MNSHWIAKQLRKYDWRLERVTQIRDIVETIAGEVRESLARKPRLLITIGGLGPTPDDMTLKGVARAIGVKLRLNKEALGMIRRYYQGMEEKTFLTRARRKMALLPETAKPLPNTVGTAPGVMIPKRGTLLVSLPGVPQEMRAIFNQSIIPILKETGGFRPRELALQITGIVESALAPLIHSVQRRYPGLYFKSHPKSMEEGRPRIQLHIYSVDEESRNKIGEAAAFIVKGLARVKKATRP